MKFDRLFGGLVSAFALMTLSCFGQQGDVAKGKKVFEQNQCVTCHGNDGKAPFNLHARLDTLTDQELEAFIKDPAAFGNRQMPAFKTILSDSEVDLLVVYIRTLSRNEKDGP